MKWSNYTSLKSASKVAFSKETVDGENIYYLTEKRFDAATGEALSDYKRGISLKELEYEKARYDSEMAQSKAESDELAKAIADFKQL